MYNLVETKFNTTLIGAILVILGVVIKNSFEQMKMGKNKMAMMFGMGSFLLGWAIVAYGISINHVGKLHFTPRTFVIFLSAVCIVVSVIQMKEKMANGQALPIIFPLLFAGAWIVLGFLAGHTNRTRILCLMASMMVLVSMMYALPHQRKKCIVDGPGMPLFVGAWILLAFGSSVSNL